MYQQWDPCQSAYCTVVVFSDRQLQRRSQVHSLPKLRSTTRATKNKYFCISVCPTQLRVFAKIRESIRERRVALPRGRFMCTQVCRTIFFTSPLWWRSPATTKEPHCIYIYIYLFNYSYIIYCTCIYTQCTRIWCKYVRLYVAKARES